MDVISFEIRFEPNPDEPGEFELSIGLLINQEEPVMDWAKDIAALYNSTQASGEYFIWTCECGVPECAGIRHGVQVVHSPDTVVWQVPQNPFECATRFAFERQAYQETVRDALDEYLQSFEAYQLTNIKFSTSACEWQLEEVKSQLQIDSSSRRAE